MVFAVSKARMPRVVVVVEEEVLRLFWLQEREVVRLRWSCMSEIHPMVVFGECNHGWMDELGN